MTCVKWMDGWINGWFLTAAATVTTEMLCGGSL